MIRARADREDNGGAGRADSASSAPGRGGLIPDCLRVGSATIISHLLALAASLAVRRFIDPAAMGVWQGLKLFLGYSNYANFGISKGAAREWSVAQGSGHVQAARRGLDLAFTFNTLASAAVAVALLAISAWMAAVSPGPLERAWCVGLAVLAVIVMLQRHVTFHVTVLRAGCDFRTTSRLSVIEAALALVCGVLGTWLWGLWGLYASVVVGLVGSWWYLRSSGAEQLHWAWDWSESRRLIAIGAPIVVAGALATLFRSLDKLAILWLAEDAEVQLGCYSMALMVGGQLYGLANMLSLVVAPRLAEMYGATGCRSAVARLAARASCGLAIAVGLAGGVAMLAAPPLLARLFPAYQQGLAPLGWVVVGSAGWAMSLPASQFLVAVSRERRMLAAVAVATAVAALADSLVLLRGGGLSAVAAATAIVYIGYSLWTSAISIFAALNHAERWKYIASHALALLPPLGLAGVMKSPLSGDSWPTFLTRLALLLAVAGPAAWMAWQVATVKQPFDLAQAQRAWKTFAERCQKPGHPQLGNWFARRISRPAALPITWILLPTGISAHGVTLAAWLVGLLAVAAFGFGSIGSIWGGAVLIQLWYLLDHVDGQIARHRRTDSLDGVALDYTMHHSLNLLLPLGIGYGLGRSRGWDGWWLVATAWGLGWLLLGLEHDVRAKAMIQRLKRLHGNLQVAGGGAGRPCPPARMPRTLPGRLAWCAHKACETHVVINLLTLIATVDVWLAGPCLLSWYTAGMALVALPLAAASIARRTVRHAAEQEFAAWYRPADDSTLVRRNGDWHVVPIVDYEGGEVL